MNISPECIEQIKAFEELRLKACLCPTGRWIMGYGHTKGVKAGDVIIPAQAEAFFKKDIHILTTQLHRFITVKVTQHQFDALGSLVFNIGVKAFSTSQLLKKLNAGDEAGAAAEFLKWRYGHGQGQKSRITGINGTTSTGESAV